MSSSVTGSLPSNAPQANAAISHEGKTTTSTSLRESNDKSAEAPSGRNNCKLWEILFVIFKNGFSAKDKHVFRDILEKNKDMLNPLSVLECILLISKVVSSCSLSGLTVNNGSFEQCILAVVETLESVIPISPGGVNQIFSNMPKLDAVLKIHSMECFCFMIEVLKRYGNTAHSECAQTYSESFSNNPDIYTAYHAGGSAAKEGSLTRSRKYPSQSNSFIARSENSIPHPEGSTTCPAIAPSSRERFPAHFDDDNNQPKTGSNIAFTKSHEYFPENSEPYKNENNKDKYLRDQGHIKNRKFSKLSFEVGYTGLWPNILNQALFLKWMILGNTLVNSLGQYYSNKNFPFLDYLKDLSDLPGNDPELKSDLESSFKNLSNHAIWSNGRIMHTLLIMADASTNKTSIPASSFSTEESAFVSGALEAAAIIFDLLRGPALNNPELLLATLVKNSDISPSLSRPLAAECMDRLSLRHGKSADFPIYIRWLAKINSSRFSSIIIAALYTRHPHKIQSIVQSIQKDRSILLQVLNTGPITPFRFHVAHLAWSKDFNPAEWLKSRLQNDSTEEKAKEFLLFLILSLCPAELLQKKLPAGTWNPMGRLHITSKQLYVYLSVVIRTCADPEILSDPECRLDEFGDLYDKKTSDDIDRDLDTLKRICARLFPHLAGFMLMLRPTNNSPMSSVAYFKDVSSQSSCLNTVSDPSISQQAIKESNWPHNNNCSDKKQRLRISCEQEALRKLALFYTDQITCDDFVSMAGRFSINQKNSDEYLIFINILKVVFYECTFFPKYPRAELELTARLMGQLISKEVMLNHGPQGSAHLLAFRCVSEALQKNDNSNMFRFGLKALEQFFGPKIACCPDFLVTVIRSSSGMRENFPQSVKYMKLCLEELRPELRRSHYIPLETISGLSLPKPPPFFIPEEFSLTSNVASRVSSLLTLHRIQNKLNLLRQYQQQQQQQQQSHYLIERSKQDLELCNLDNKLEKERCSAQEILYTKIFSASEALQKQRPLIIKNRAVFLDGFSLGAVEQLLSSDISLKVPDIPEWFQEQLVVTMNCLVASNLTQKADSLKKCLKPEWEKNLVVYMVKSRASKEPNLHQLYIKLLELLGSETLIETVLTISHDCINVLLTYCDAAIESSSYRTFLKNLGSWLGALTLARDRSLNSESLDIVAVLSYGLEKGKLRALLPLVCKVLEKIRSSKVFRPPHSWTVTVLSLLAEIHSVPGLITPLMFEIELLFKNLAINLDEYKGRSGILTKIPVIYGKSKDLSISPDKEVVKKSIKLKETSCNIQKQASTTNQFVVSADLSENREVQRALKESLSERGERSENVTDSTLPRASILHEKPSSGSYMYQESQATAEENMKKKKELDNVGSTSSRASSRSESPVKQKSPVKQESHINNQESTLVRTFSPPSKSYTSSEDEGKNARNTDEFFKKLIPVLRNCVVISPSLLLFHLQPELREIIPYALGEAIKEVLHVVADRSVMISCAAARKIILKDFEEEPSENLVKTASYSMAASLAGSIALVTCREALRASISQHIRNMLQSLCEKLAQDQRLFDQIVTVTTADNLELGCSLVEEAVIHKAFENIEVVMASSLSSKTKRVRVPEFTDNHMPLRNLSAVPTVLLRKSFLSSNQLQVYSDFFSFGPLKRLQMNVCNSESDTMLNRINCLKKKMEEEINLRKFSSPLINMKTESVLVDNAKNMKPQELTEVMIKVEKLLYELKVMVYEVALCNPVALYDVTNQGSQVTYVSQGCTAKILPHSLYFNKSLFIISNLPSDHDAFLLILNIPGICSRCVKPETAFSHACRKLLELITGASFFFKENPASFRGTRISSLQLEFFLGALAHLVEVFTEYTSHKWYRDLLNWLSPLLENKFFGVDVALGLLRYDLLTPEKVDRILLGPSGHLLEKKERTTFETMLKLLYRIANGALVRDENIIELSSQCKGTEKLSNGSDSINEVSFPMINRTSKEESPVNKADTSNPVEDSELQVEETISELPKTDPALNGGKRVITNVEDNTVKTSTQLLKDYVTYKGYVIKARPSPPPYQPVAQKQRENLVEYFTQWFHSSQAFSCEKRSKFWFQFFLMLSKQKILQMDKVTNMFIGCSLDKAVEISMINNQIKEEYYCKLRDDIPLRNLRNIGDDSKNNQEEMLNYLTFENDIPDTKPLDAFSRMLVAMMRLIDATQISPVFILQRSLSIIVRCLIRDASGPNIRKVNVRAYYRILLSLIWEIIQPNRGLDQHLTSCLLCFSNAYDLLNPSRCPVFTFCWFELVSHKSFLPKMLRHVRGWSNYSRLILSLFRLLYTSLRHGIFTKSISVLYKGTLRLLLVILHDFPEFLCEYCTLFSNNLPLNCHQLRNIILSAFPRNMRLPDPFTLDIKKEILPECKAMPIMSSQLSGIINHLEIEGCLEEFYKTENAEYLKETLPRLIHTDENVAREVGTKYDICVFSDILMYLVTKIPKGLEIHDPENSKPLDPVANSIVLFLVNALEPEGRYILLSCISNYLRFPSFQTYYFSSLILWLFSSTKNQQIQEQVTCVLLERLISRRPHPWGLLFTFIQLIRNPTHSFWNCSLARKNPAVRRIKDLLATSLEFTVF